MINIQPNEKHRLRRAPVVSQACYEAYGASTQAYVISLRELLGVIIAYEWRKNGLPVLADEKIEVSCRAAIAGYMLRRWGVDCSLESSLNPEEYHLALQNIESLASTESADLAPGYKRTKGLA